MKFDFTEIEELSGNEAHIYSVTMEGDEETLLEQFFNENSKNKKELNILVSKILNMSQRTGCKRDFFKEGEGDIGDGVVALKAQNLRLYGIYFNNSVVLFGSGGIKRTRTYQEDEKLYSKVKQVKAIAKEINKAIKERTIIIESDGRINIENWENYE